MWQTRKNENNFNIKKSPIRKENLPNYNYIDYADIAKQKFKTGRNVNPLDPVYDVKFGNEPIGQIDKSKPNPLYKLVYSDPLNLKTNDISGAQIGTKNKINKFTNSECYNLIIADIPGTAVGSLKNHISTNRHVNPVCPEYLMPGHSTLGEQFNPYGEKQKSGDNKGNNPDKDNDQILTGRRNKEKNENDILDEINQVSKAYLNERKREKRPLSQGGYTYSRSIVSNNNIKNEIGVSNKKDKESSKNLNEKKIDQSNLRGKVKNKNLNELNYQKQASKENGQEDKIYKRIDSGKHVHFEGKENLKANEVIGFNNQIYSIPP